MKIGEEELAFLLKRQNMGISYAEFREKAAKQEKQEIQAKKDLQKALQKTAQTLFDFGSAMDRVTTAIANALRPLFEEIGLVEKGGKAWSGFGDIMKGATEALVKFFNALAKSKEWEKVMRGLGRGLVSFGKWVANLKSEDITRFFNKAISAIKTFAKWSKILIGVWMAGKGLALMMNIGRVIGGIGGVMKGAAGAAPGAMQTAMGGIAGRWQGMTMGKAFAGAGIGTLTGQLTGGGTVAGSLGGTLGGALGMLGGPIGSQLEESLEDS